MKRALSAFLALVVAAVAHGHHSFPSMYDLNQEVTIKGTVVAIMLRNPHTVIQVMAPASDGQLYRWAIEWAAAGTLERTTGGVLLKPGDRVIVRGAPGRNPADHKLRLTAIVRPSDGWKWGGKFD